LSATLAQSLIAESGRQFFLSSGSCTQAFSEMLERRAGSEAEPNPELAIIWYKLALRSWLISDGSLSEKAASCAHVLGLLFHNAADYKTSRSLLEDVLQAFHKWFGKGTESSITVALQLSIVLLDMDLAEDARGILEPTYETSQRSLGAKHPLTLACRTNIADA